MARETWSLPPFAILEENIPLAEETEIPLALEHKQ
jgi:hypothetical protein